MSTCTIVRGGDQAFQLPSSMIHSLMTVPINGQVLRLLYWILWEAQKEQRWPSPDEDPHSIVVRYCGHAMRKGAALDSENGYGALREALRRLSRVRFVGCDVGEESAGHVVAEFVERPGPHFDVVLPAVLSGANWRPLARYALVNMDHIRGLRQPLDFALYTRACEVARAYEPRFEMRIQDIASISGAQTQPNWPTLRRPILGACERVAKQTNGRFILQAWCAGDQIGFDRILVRVGLDGQRMRFQFPPRHRAHFFEVDPRGWRRLALPTRTSGR
jgi:hypothetical protein